MPDMTGPDELLAEVLARYDESPNPRLQEVMQAAIRHLHAFAREVDLQRDEWFAGIQWLTATGQMCSDTRQEFILLSDTIGLSTLVEMLSYSGAEGTTENTVLGPFYAAGSPERANGESMLDDDDRGDKVVVRGTITNADGEPLDGRRARLLAEQHRRVVHGAEGRRAERVQPARHLPHRRRRQVRDPHGAPGQVPDPARRPGRPAAQGQQPRVDAARSPPHVGQAARVQGTDHPHLRPQQRSPLRRRRVRRAREPDRRLHTRRDRRAGRHVRLRARPHRSSAHRC